MTFSVSQSQCSEDAFVQQGCFSGAPQKQSQSRDGAAQGPNHPVEREHERPFVQGAHRKGWRGRGGDFTVLNVLIKKQEWEAEQCTRGQRKWWQSGGFHVLSASPARWPQGSSRRSKALPPPFPSLSTARITSQTPTMFVVGLLLESVG